MYNIMEETVNFKKNEKSDTFGCKGLINERKVKLEKKAKDILGENLYGDLIKIKNKRRLTPP